MGKQLKIMVAVLFLLYGILIGSHLEVNQLGEPSDYQSEFVPESQREEIERLSQVNEGLRERIHELQNEVESMERERAEGSIALQLLVQEVEEYRMLAGYREVAGPGIVIVLEGMYEENIAPLVYQRKYLITLVNELKGNSAEAVAVNGYRITALSEMSLAGNHIQVNGRPIAPPYRVEAIGNRDDFQRYVNQRTLLFDLMKNEGIESDIQFEEELTLSKPHREPPIRFMEVKES